MIASLPTAGRAPALDELRWLLRNSRTPRWRTTQQFAEEEIYIPDGRYRGSRFKVSRQPWTGLWLKEVDSGRWRTSNSAGPTQSGKSLVTFITPVCYHLFEIGANVVCGVPDLNMVADKWAVDLLPVIQKTRYASLLPERGEGSRGGVVHSSVTFRNGAVLRFMTGGGGDSQRAAFTSRVLAVTEVNSFAKRGQTSYEASKLHQLIGRTLHYGELARIYLEGTVTIAQDPGWALYVAGTESRIACPCVHCGRHVTIEREHLVGWQEAQNEIEAELLAWWHCPACGQKIGDAERAEMNRRAVLLHRGQSIAGDAIAGEAPATHTLGFRWSAFNNLFLPTGHLGALEWAAARESDEDNAERRQRQQIWCLPYKPAQEDLVALDAVGLQSRQGRWPRGQVPDDCELLTVGCDVGKYRLHWHGTAWRPGGSSQVFGYGEIIVESDKLGEEQAIFAALVELRRMCETGWAWEGKPRSRPADQVGVDAGYQDKVVYAFIKDCSARPDTYQRYWPTKGFGEGQLSGHAYSGPKKTGATVQHVGQDYHFANQPAHGVVLLEFAADPWKTFHHNRLACPRDHAGAMLFHTAVPKEHTKLCRHLTAEKKQREYTPEHGERDRWVRIRQQNHYLDAGVIADVLGHFAGVRIVEPAAPPRAPAPSGPPPVTLPDGRPFSILER